MKKKLCFLLLFSIPFILFAQDFTKVDSLAKATPYAGENISAFAKKLTTDHTSNLNKVRAIFTWICDQVSYDCNAFFDPKASQRSIQYKTKQEYQKKVRDWERKQAKEAFYNKKGMCMNYTLLFKYMCQSIGVKAEVIDGRIKSSAKEIKGSYIGVNHAWSAVQLEDKWYLLDLTLASGFVRKNCSEFVKEFRDEYFMVPPQQFIHTHLPKSPKWQHLRSKVKQKEFMALPYAAYGAHKFGVSQMSPKQGTLTSDTTSFRIELQHLEIFDRVVLYEDDLTIFPNVSLEDQTLSFDYFRNKPDAKYLSIHFETLEKSFLVLRYKLD